MPRVFHYHNRDFFLQRNLHYPIGAWRGDPQLRQAQDRDSLVRSLCGVGFRNPRWNCPEHWERTFVDQDQQREFHRRASSRCVADLVSQCPWQPPYKIVELDSAYHHKKYVSSMILDKFCFDH